MTRFFLITCTLMALLQLAQSKAMPQQAASASPELITEGITCDIQTERRDTELSGSTIAQMLLRMDRIIKVCSSPEGNGADIQLSNDLQYSIRSAQNIPPLTCRLRYISIIQICIANGTSWGGRYFDASTGDQFDVKNTAYPVWPAPVAGEAPVAPELPAGATVVTANICK